MAEVSHHVFQSNTTVTTANATPTTAYTLGTSAQLPAGDYIMIVSALHGSNGGSGTNNRREMEIHDNGTLIADTYQRIEPESITDGQGNHYGIVKRFTKAATGDVTLEIYNGDAVNVSVYAAEALFILLDDLVENTDFLHSVNTTSDLNVGGYKDGVSVTVPADASESWLCFAHVQWRIDDTGGIIHKMKIVDDATDRAEILLESEDTNETYCMMTAYPIAGAASSKTVKIQYSNNSTGDVLVNEIFMLRLGAFKNSGYAAGGTATVTAADTWVESENLAFTANHSGDHCVIAGGIVADADNLNMRERRLTSEVGGGGETTVAGSAVRQLAGNGAATEDLPVFMVADVTYSNSDSVDLDMDVGDAVNNTNESWSSCFIAQFTFELAASGITITVPTGPWR